MVLSPQNFHLIDFNVLTVTTIVLARRLIGAVVKEVKPELSFQEICKALHPFCCFKPLHPCLKPSVMFPSQNPRCGFQWKEQRTELSSLSTAPAGSVSFSDSEFLSQPGCGDCASLLSFGSFPALHHSSFPQGRARDVLCGEQCQESGLDTGDYQSLNKNSPHSLRNEAQIPQKTSLSWCQLVTGTFFLAVILHMEFSP